MDSDDGAFLVNFELMTKLGPSAPEFVPTSLELKLYQRGEHESLNVLYREALSVGSTKGLDWKDDYSSYFRLKRFLDSIKGFHEGNLDLTGRHWYRYQELLDRWNQFLPDVLKLSRYAFKCNQPISVGTDELDVNPVIPNFYTVDPPELWECFADKWRVHNVPLTFIFPETNKLFRYLRSHTKPKFQEQLLEKLPPELIHEIMGKLECDDSRRLGATSKYFRTFALSYMYRDQHFDLQIEPDPSFRLPLQSGDPEQMSTFYEGARRVILKRLSACSDPNIARTMETISLFGMYFNHLFHALNFDVGSPDYLELFNPIGMQVGVLIKETTKLKEISLSQFFFTEDFVQALLSLPRLHTIRVYDCVLDSFPDPAPQCESLLNLFIDVKNEVSGSTQFNLLKSCANLQFLYISSGADLEEFDLGPESRAACNPFGTLKRLILKDFDYTNIELLGTWSSGSSTRLTHLKLQGCSSEFGIWFQEVDCLMNAFRDSPLEVLVLEGLQFAHPDVFDMISITFPTLRSLTLLYSQSPRRRLRVEPAYWPYRSWEYAPGFLNFSHLEHFGWNFGVNDLEVTSLQTLLEFEDGFTTCLSEEEFEELDGQSLADRDSIARVLAAHCPTLKEVAFHPDGYPDCKISRTPSGVIEVTGGDVGFGTTSQTRGEAWAEDPTMWQVLPRS